MKNCNIKKILSLVLFVALALTVVFVLSSCGEHVHEFETETVKATCTEDGYVKTFCKCGAKEIKVDRATGHNLVVKSEIKATCTEDGKTVKTCACGYTETVEVKATGHSIVKHDAVKVSCTADGNNAYETCKNCDYTTYEKIAATGHNPGEAVQENVNKFTCTENGSFDEVVYCTNCSSELSRKTETVLAPGHAWNTVEQKAATCVVGWYAHEECGNCGEKKDYVEIAPKYDHIQSEHPVEIEGSRVNPTCTEDGYYLEAVVCTHDCGYAFTEPTERILPALGHSIVEHDAQAPDCVNHGWKAYETCARCEEYTTYEEIAKLGHTNLAPVEENRTQPDCTNVGGYDMATYCETCGIETGRVHTVVPALGHDYVDHDGKSNSCTEDGWNAYQTCTRCDYTTYELVPAHGHNKVELSEIENFVEPTCTTEGSYDVVYVCDICEIELDRVSWTVPSVAHNTLGVVDAKAPTCTEPGYEAYTCCSKCGYSDNKVELPASGHKITKHDAKAPTCTEIGWDAYETCSECDYTTYVEKDALDHDIVHLAAVSATCTKDGLTAGQYCTRCDGATVKQSVITAPGHDLDSTGLCGTCGYKVSLGLTYDTVDGGYAFVGTGNCEDKNIVIPSEVNGVPVVAVSDNAFKYSDVESVVIPASVKVVGRDAFFACSSLTSVVIEGATDIEDYAFFGCGKLTSVTFGASVKSIGDNAFGSCRKLTTVYYDGTAAQWSAITIGTGNEKLTGATKYYI